jgi:ABC-type Fe3+/spermidine/putrescine transport system ATPase subunit
MNRGVVLQQGAPQDVFTKPQHEDVASAVGIKNFWQAE